MAVVLINSGALTLLAYRTDAPRSAIAARIRVIMMRCPAT